MPSLVLKLGLSALFPVVVALFALLRYHYRKRVLDNIPGPRPQNFFHGNQKQFISAKSAIEFHGELASDYGGNGVVKIRGFCGDKQLYVFDHAAMYSILIRDQYVYEESSTFIDGNTLVFGKSLLSTLGEHHRKQRKLLNPVFSVKHMRHLTPIFNAITHKLRSLIERKVLEASAPAEGVEIDMLAWMSRTALELIGQGGLGHSFGPLESPANDALSGSLKKLIPALIPLTTSRQVLPWVINVGSPAFRRWIVDVLPWRNLHNVRDIVNTMEEASKEILEDKKRGLKMGDEQVMQQMGEGKDIMSILLKANMENGPDSIPESEVRAQMSTFILAGLDTTSGALSRILHQLALHPQVQSDLRREIRDARATRGGDLDHDELMALPLLEAVCRETLRLFPPVSAVIRTTREDIMMPLTNPLTGVDGTLIREIFVPSNTEVRVGIVAANRNSDIWGPDAHQWKPERFLSPLPASVTEARIPGVYSHLMTFIGGGRACIGFKFSQLEMKVVLSILLDSFEFGLPRNKEINWVTHGLQTPTCEGSSTPSLPLHVKLAARE